MRFWKRKVPTRLGAIDHVELSLLKANLYGVVGFSTTPKERIRKGKKVAGSRVVRVYVDQKKPAHILGRYATVPRKVGAFETDVVEIGDVKVLAGPPPIPPDIRHMYLDMLLPGTSIGHRDVTAGTIGRPVELNGEVVILSNNHVLANASMEEDWRALVGDPIYQPGPADIRDQGGEPEEKFLAAELVEWVPYKQTGNLVDAAVARPLIKWRLHPWKLNYTELSRIAEVDEDTVVTKSGRTTGVTKLLVLDDAATLQVMINGQSLEFVDQLLLEDVNRPGTSGSGPGDSGSLVVEVDDAGKTWNAGLPGRAQNVGLLFAGSDRVTVVNKMRHVVEAFSSPLSLAVPDEGDPDSDEEPKIIKYRESSANEIVNVVESPTGPEVEWRNSVLELESGQESVEVGRVFTIRGRLRDAVSGEGIPGRLVELLWPNESSLVTDGDGRFSGSTTWSTAGEKAVVAVFDGDTL